MNAWNSNVIKTYYEIFKKMLNKNLAITMCQFQKEDILPSFDSIVDIIEGKTIDINFKTNNDGSINANSGLNLK